MSDPGIHNGASPQSAPSGVPRAAAPHRSWPERVILSVGVIGVAIALIGAGVLNWAGTKWEAIEQVPIASIEAAESGSPANWLLVGSDERTGIDPDDPRSGIFLGDEVPGGKRTDTMIIARVDPQGAVINLLSVPRDLWVPIAGTDGSGRVNTAFNGDGGEERLVNTIEQYFGIDINHYAEINFVGFQDVVDSLGGVPIWFDQPMRDPGSALDISSAGCHILDGFDALAFARGRKLEYFSDGSWHFDPTGDLGRTSRQQYFIRQVAETATRKLDITSLSTINGLLDAGGQNLAISGVEAGDLISLAKLFKTVEPEQIIGHSLPVYDFRTEGGAAVLGLLEEEAAATLDIFRGIEPVSAEGVVETSTTSTTVLHYTVKVLNGSQIGGQAGATSSSLGAVGFDMSEADNADPIDKTVVAFGPGMEAGAIEVARYLGVNPVVRFDATLAEVVVTTGKDFAGVLATPRAASAIVVEAAPTTTAPPTTAAPEVAAVPATPPSTIGVIPGPSPEGTLCE